jgi:hypothetical protein
MKEIEILKSILATNFRYEFYDNAIKNAKIEIRNNSYYRENWNNVIELIISRRMIEGEPLRLIHDSANLAIYENTDTEAYRWLDLFLSNVAMTDDTVVSYQIDKNK